MISNKSKAINIINKISCKKDKLTTTTISKIREVLDPEKTFFEGFSIWIRISKRFGDRLRYSGLFNESKKKGDRARKIGYKDPAFNLTLTKNDKLKIYFRSNDIRPFINFLRDKIGIDPYEIDLLFEKIYQFRERSKISLEIPLKEYIPRIRISTRAGDKEIISDITRSHFESGEMEIKGNSELVQNFINAIAGIQHFSVIDFMTYLETKDLNKNYEKMNMALKDFLKALEDKKESPIIEGPKINNKKDREVSYIG